MKKAVIVLSAVLLGWGVGLFAQETETKALSGRVIRGISTVPPKPVVKVTGVNLDKRKMTLFAGGEAQKLTATVIPARADNQGIDWRSYSNGTVAKVADGIVSPVGLGTDTIFAVSKIDATRFAVCAVEVKIDSLAVYRAQYQSLNAQIRENNGKVILLENGQITYLQAHKKALLPDFVFYILGFFLFVLLVFLFLLNKNKNEKIAGLEDVNKQLDKRCALLVQEKNTLIGDNKTLSGEVDRLQNTNTELRGEIFEHNQKAKSLEETIEKLKKQLK